MKQKKDRIQDIPKVLLITIIALLILSLTPNNDTEFVEFKKVDLISDIVDKVESVFNDSSLFAIDTTHIDSTVKDSLIDSSVIAKTIIKDTGATCSKVIPIEDFSDSKNAMSHFYQALKNINTINRPVRIAFIGDSFIEGDILTSDLRELLQSNYGGQGVGFVPIVSVVKYKNTIKQDFKKWKTYSMIRSKEVDKSKLTLNGQYFVPDDGAMISLESTKAKAHSASYNKVSLLFSSERNTSVKLNINKSELYDYETIPKQGLQLFEIKHKGINSVSYDFTNVENFVGYGIYLHDDNGIYVDNFGLRSSTGMTLSFTNTKLLSELNSLIKYDLVILQYGLNIAEPEKTSYTHYQNKMVEVIKHLQSAMPQTSFMILSIGDRNFKSNGQMKTMPGIVKMVETQREIARDSKIAFWNTYMAMGGENSMTKFVLNSPPLANKDYTHINYAGGQTIAKSLTESLIEASNHY